MLDGLAALGFLVLPQLSIFRPATGGASTVLVWMLSLSAAAPIVVRRLWPVPVFLVVMAVSFVALPSGLAPTSLLAAAYALYMVAVTRERRSGPSATFVGGLSVAGAAVLMVTGAQDYPGGTQPVQIAVGVLVLGATWAAGSSVRERRESMRRFIEQMAERAKVEERLRIARDIHDVVTHSIGLVAVKAGIANHVLVTHPEEAKEALAVIEDVSRTALRDMRATLKVLRPDHADGESLRPAPGLSDLPALIKTAEAAGVRVELRTRYADEPPDGIALSAFRVVQEALTNVIKHAAPTRCEVSIVAEKGSMKIDVTDDGPGPAHRTVVLGGGLGLVGMRERVAAHGGTITTGPRPGGGFQVSAALPY